jgi:hypothetical protein
MDKWQFRTLMLQGKRVWVSDPDEQDALDYTIEGIGYIWSIEGGCDLPWIGRSYGDEQPELCNFPSQEVYVDMGSYTLPLAEVYAFIDKLGGFSASES